MSARQELKDAVINLNQNQREELLNRIKVHYAYSINRDDRLDYSLLSDADVSELHLFVENL